LYAHRLNRLQWLIGALAEAVNEMREVLAPIVPVEAEVIIEALTEEQPKKSWASVKVYAEQANGTEKKALRAGERKMIETLVALYPEPLTRQQLATLSGFAVRGGTFQQYLGTLRRNGLMQEIAKGRILTTAEGLNTVGAVLKVNTSEQVIDMWKRSLRLGERKILDLLVKRYPREVTTTDIGEHIEMTVTGGTFQQYMGVLRRNGLIERGDSGYRASPTLFISNACTHSAE
jgi:hypothetical protein